MRPLHTTNSKLSVTLISILFLQACSPEDLTDNLDDQNNANNPDNQQVVLAFNDQKLLISGLGFETTGQSGVTDQNGEFSCPAGEQITFRLGSSSLGSFNCDALSDITSLYPNSLPITQSEFVPLLNNINDINPLSVFANQLTFLAAFDTDRNLLNGINLGDANQRLSTATPINFNASLSAFKSQEAYQQLIDLYQANDDANYKTTISGLYQVLDIKVISQIPSIVKTYKNIVDENNLLESKYNAYSIRGQLQHSTTTRYHLGKAYNVYGQNYSYNDQLQLVNDSNCNGSPNEDEIITCSIHKETRRTYNDNNSLNSQTYLESGSIQRQTRYLHTSNKIQASHFVPYNNVERRLGVEITLFDSLGLKTSYSYAQYNELTDKVFQEDRFSWTYINHRPLKFLELTDYYDYNTGEFVTTSGNQFDYEHLNGLMVKSIKNDAPEPDATETKTFTFDDEQNQTNYSVSYSQYPDEDNSWVRTYNQNRQWLSHQSNSGTTKSQAFDTKGNLTQTSQYQANYNDLGTPVTTTHQNGASVSIESDQWGNITKVSVSGPQSDIKVYDIEYRQKGLGELLGAYPINVPSFVFNPPAGGDT